MTDFKELKDMQIHRYDDTDYEYRSEQIGKANGSKRRSKTVRDLFILLAVAVFVLAIASVSLACDGEAKAAAKTEAPKVFDSEQAIGTKATCPVMGKAFTIGESTQHEEYKGKHVYFCCPGCVGQFKADPDKYLK